MTLSIFVISTRWGFDVLVLYDLCRLLNVADGSLRSSRQLAVLLLSYHQQAITGNAWIIATKKWERTYVTRQLTYLTVLAWRRPAYKTSIVKD